MKRAVWGILALFAVACGGDDDPARPRFVPPDAGDADIPDRVTPSDGSAGDAGAGGDGSGGAGDGGVADADAAVDNPDGGDSGGNDSDGSAADGGDTPDGTAPDDAGSDATVGPADPPLCSLSLRAEANAKLGISTAEDDAMGSLADDELTIAFSVSDGNAVKVVVGERNSLAVSFTKTDEFSGAFAFDRAALLPNGLVLVIVNADGRGFTRLSRAARDQSFTLDPTAEFDSVVATLEASERLGDPVFAIGGQMLVYSRYGGSRAQTVFAANRLGTSVAFTPASVVGVPDLHRQGTLRRRPTAAPDDRTLVYFDEVTQTSKIGRFERAFAFNQPFDSVTDLGAVRGLQPSKDCTRLYFDAPDGADRDLFGALAASDEE